MPQQLPTTCRLMCVDDNEMLIDSLRRLVSYHKTIVWAGHSFGGGDVVKQIGALRPDVVLMDVDIPGVDTFALVELVNLEVPHVRVVMFSGHLQPTDVVQALDSGAWGYLSKNEDTGSLLEAIVRVGKGEVVLSEDVKLIHRRTEL